MTDEDPRDDWYSWAEHTGDQVCCLLCHRGYKGCWCDTCMCKTCSYYDAEPCPGEQKCEKARKFKRWHQSQRNLRTLAGLD